MKQKLKLIFPFWESILNLHKLQTLYLIIYSEFFKKN